MIRIAQPEDYDLVLAMAKKFMDSTPYKDIADAESVERVVLSFLNWDKTEKIILLYEDKGFLAAGITPFPFGFKTLVATEVAWYVEPEARKEGVGDKLVEAFEYWADKLGVKVKTLAFMDTDLTNYMKKKGYVPYETAHYKMS